MIGELVIARRRSAATAWITTSSRARITTAATSATEDAAENRAPYVDLAAAPSWEVARVHVLLCVVIHGVDEGIEFLRVHHVPLVIRAPAGRVNPVGKKHDRLATLNF